MVKFPIDLIKRVIAYRKDSMPYWEVPAAQAFARIGITRASQVGRCTETELLALQGITPKVVRMLRSAGVQLKEE